MTSPEHTQPVLDFSPATQAGVFDYDKRSLAQQQLEALRSPSYPEYEPLHSLRQHRLEQYRSFAADPEWLEAHIEQLVARGRSPYFTPPGDCMLSQAELERNETRLDNTSKEDRAVARRQKHYAVEPYGQDEAEYSLSSVWPELSEFRHVWRTASFYEFTANPGYKVASGTTPKSRLVQAPNPIMERIHTSFLQNSGKNYNVHSCAYGLQADKSYADMAKVHAGHRYVAVADIKSAYDNVDPMLLARQLATSTDNTVGTLGWYPLVVRFFMPPDASKGLATGGNASPFLFNLYMREFDETIALYCESYGITYTRYMDDLVFSAQDTGSTDQDRLGKRKLRFVKDALKAIGMQLNMHKIRIKDLKTDGPVMLPGAQLDYEGNWGIPTRSAANMHSHYSNIGSMLLKGRMPSPEEVGQVHGLNGYTLEFARRRITPSDYGLLDTVGGIESLQKSELLPSIDAELLLAYMAVSSRLRIATGD